MDDQLLDAICGCLVSLLKYSRKLYSLRRFYGDAFYYQGKTRELNSKWRVNSFLQLNYFETWTVRALEEVEAFALRAEDLKFVANQFRRLHGKKLEHTFPFYAYHWRTWAACFIQAAWSRHKKRMIAKILSMSESSVSVDEQTVDDETMREEDAPSFAPSNSQAKQHLGVTILASRFAANTRRGAQFCTFKFSSKTTPWCHNTSFKICCKHQEWGTESQEC